MDYFCNKFLRRQREIGRKDLYFGKVLGFREEYLNINIFGVMAICKSTNNYLLLLVK